MPRSRESSSELFHAGFDAEVLDFQGRGFQKPIQGVLPVHATDSVCYLARLTSVGTLRVFMVQSLQLTCRRKGAVVPELLLS